MRQLLHCHEIKINLWRLIFEKFDSKVLLTKDILSQEEYISKFFGVDNIYIKREYYSDYITQRLSKELGMHYNEKTKKWCSEWNDNKRFVVELYGQRGTQIVNE